MNTFYKILAVAILFFPSVLDAQNESGKQQLFLSVAELNKIGLTNPSVNIIIDKVPAEGETIMSSNTDGSILWTTNGQNRKITVALNRSSSQFTLKVLAEKVSRLGGIAGPEVTLNDEQVHDLILGVSKTAGRCTLRLTAISSLTDPVGSETRVLTYTIMNN